jgi:queuine tRNA-ribosyltransferase
MSIYYFIYGILTLLYMNNFTTKSSFGSHGRSGVLHTRRGDVKTPTFMPDGTRGAVKSLTPEQVASTGVEVVLANTYHLHLSPGEQVVKNLGGLHGFANREGPMLTDSGGFQVFSLGKHTKITEEGVEFTNPNNGDVHFISPEKSMQIQLDLGADMIVAFDHLIGLDDSVTEAMVKDAFDRTHRWLARCITEFKKLTADMIGPEDARWSDLACAEPKRPALFGVVQGGLDIELRKESLRIIQESDVDGIAIGGLSVGESREEMRIILEALAPLYDQKRPRFLLGVGTPEDLRIAVDNGIDMLDCVLPTRNARHSAVWTTDSKRINLTNEQFTNTKEVIEPGCDCYACAKGFSKGFLRHQFKVSEPLAGTLASIHNLRHMIRICEEYRTK